MSKVKKASLIVLSYIIAFIVSVCVSGFILNQGKVSGVIQNTGASLPVLYVKTGGRLMNEMHGYRDAVDAGYYRDTLTPVGDSQTINLCMNEYDYPIVSGSYELYNDRYDTLIESGECTGIEKVNAMLQMQVVFKSKLFSNREYCLRLMMTDEDGQVFNYYTRVRYGSDLKAAEKMKFVLDFNEATFDKDSASQLESYLETSSSASNSNFSLVTLYSSSDAVTWGNMAPYRTSEVAIRLKEINTETAAFTLTYTIESSSGDINTFYRVEEYYRIRWTSTKIYLLDFERRMKEDISLTDISVENGALRIGIGDTSDVSVENYGTEEQQYTYLAGNSQLWLFDSTNRILTKVYAESDERHNCSREDELGIKVVHADPATGDLHFIVYGYMHDGNYEGREGVMLYRFSHEDVMLEELAFIPFDKGFQQLESGLERLAYMNDRGEIYLLLEETVYCIDATLGRMETAWTGLNSSNCSASDTGILVLSDGGNEYGGERLRIIDLNTDKEKKIEGGQWLITPLGFAGDDLIYGLLDPQLVAEDSAGIVQAPISEVHIIDSDLNEIKSYQKDSSYIMRLTISEGNIALKLGKAVKNGSYTDYEDAGEDYIIRNSEADTGAVYLETRKDSIRGVQNWLKLDTSNSFVPITQTARYLDPGYDITKEYESSDSVELCYYVYTKGRLDGTFSTVREAIDYGRTYAGTVMSSHKQILWQRAGRAYIWDLDIDAIGQADEATSLNKVILETITEFEDWQMPSTVDASQPLFAAMTEALPVETIDLTGIELDDVLHFIYRDRLVAARISDNMYALIIAYDNNYIQLADPEEGDTYWLSMSAAESLFEENGNVFYSYID
ncbi:MAG: hypothetical protein ACI4BB_05360 [Coprococcus sp.]